MMLINCDKSIRVYLCLKDSNLSHILWTFARLLFGTILQPITAKFIVFRIKTLDVNDHWAMYFSALRSF